MKEVMKKTEKMIEIFKSIPLIFEQKVKITTLEMEIEGKNARIKELESIIKSDLYKEFMANFEAPHKIIDLQNTLKLRTQQRNSVREDNTKLREQIKGFKDQSIMLENVTKQRDRYKKQVKTLKDIIKEGK